MSKPLVSVLIPTYNGERFLKAAVRSVTTQSHRELEIIVGDDASTDRTPEILAALAAEDHRITVLRHPVNVGAFENPARLLRAATGEYVKFLLHDDVLATDCVRDMARALADDPTLGLAFAHRNLIGEDGRALSTGQPAPLRDRETRWSGTELADAVLENVANVIGELSSVMFRRADVDPEQLWTVDGRRMAVLGDLALFLELLRRGDAWYSPRALSRFRVHPGQRSQDPGLIALGAADWPYLVDWASRSGFLAEPAQRQRAHAAALHVLAVRLRQTLEHGAHPVVLDALALSTTRLRELGLAPSAPRLPDADPERSRPPESTSTCALAGSSR